MINILAEIGQVDCTHCFVVAKEAFVTEVDVLREELRESEVVIEGEFVPESSMVEWGWTPRLS